MKGRVDRISAWASAALPNSHFHFQLWRQPPKLTRGLRITRRIQPCDRCQTRRRGAGINVFRKVLIGSFLLLLAAGHDSRAQTPSLPVLTIDDAVTAGDEWQSPRAIQHP